MALINFGYRVDMNSIPSPLGSASFILAYDLDGELKQKDADGIISKIGGGSQTFNNVNIYSTQSGVFTLQDGSENAGYFLKSDGNGTAQWAPIDTTDVNTLVFATYSGLQTLVANDGLIVGASYILTDYQTIYQINNSNSNDIEFISSAIGEAVGYSQMSPDVPTDIGGPGDYASVKVVIDSVPPTASPSLYPGLTLSIVEWFNGRYIEFAPTLVGSNNYGIKLKFLKQRYPNVISSGTYLDNYGKPILKPGGVINVDVHDGTPYMSMTASENPIPVMESLILTAIDVNKFSRNAESLTYHGDKIIYDFLDNKIYDENGAFLRNRPGNILNRSNIDGSITMDKDWRIQRYRRYAVDTKWSDLTLAGTSSGSYIYKIPSTASGVNMCSVTNTSITTDHKYISHAPFMKNFYINFSKNNAYNIFLSGTTSNTSITDGNRRYSESNIEYMNDLTITSFTQSVKDFTILPLKNYEVNTDLVEECMIYRLENTVFLPYSTTNGLTNILSVNSETGSIKNSTFITLPSIVNNGGDINKITAIDRASITVYNTYLYNSIMLCMGNLTTNSNISNCTFGAGGAAPFFDVSLGTGCSLNSSIIGGNRYNYTRFKDLFTMNSLIIFNKSTIVLYGSMYLTMLKSNGDNYGCEYSINTYSNTNPNKISPNRYGYVYDFTVTRNDTIFHNNTLNKRLVYSYLDNANATISVTASAAQ